LEAQQELEKEIIHIYAEAYQNLGYSSLMGKIVALLIISPEPLSLDEIAERLEMSKGPISQIARRLKDHHLIERVWIPGERKDFYKATDDIFGQAFRNYAISMKRNYQIADRFVQRCDEIGNGDIAFTRMRMEEMKAFYALMEQHNKDFIKAWTQTLTDFKNKR
jgi:DNA-binding transcriptional regulator GbsR (MarR family)